MTTVLTHQQAEHMADMCERMAEVFKATPKNTWAAAMERTDLKEPSFLETLVCLAEELTEETARLRAAMTEEKAVAGLRTWTDLVQVPVLIERLKGLGMDPVELHRRLTPTIPLPLLDLAKALGEVAVDAAWWKNHGCEKRPTIRFTVPRGDGYESDDDLEK